MTIDETPLVEIALAVYNGERYLDEFMVSVEKQQYSNWKLLVRDDASSDDSAAIIRRWEKQLDSKVSQTIDSGKKNLGIAGTFTSLLQETTADYVMLADYDDVWYPEKFDLL
jgi:rhamnosyltransferase